MTDPAAAATANADPTAAANAICTCTCTCTYVLRTDPTLAINADAIFAVVTAAIFALNERDLSARDREYHMELRGLPGLSLPARKSLSAHVSKYTEELRTIV